MKKKLLEYFFEKRLQKSNQKRFRDKKVLKKKVILFQKVSLF